MIPLIFPKVPNLPIGILRVPQKKKKTPLKHTPPKIQKPFLHGTAVGSYEVFTEGLKGAPKVPGWWLVHQPI